MDVTTIGDLIEWIKVIIEFLKILFGGIIGDGEEETTASEEA